MDEMRNLVLFAYAWLHFLGYVFWGFNSSHDLFKRNVGKNLKTKKVVIISFIFMVFHFVLFFTWPILGLYRLWQWEID